MQGSITEASSYVPLKLLLPKAFAPAVTWLANTFPDAKQIEALRVRQSASFPFAHHLLPRISALEAGQVCASVSPS